MMRLTTVVGFWLAASVTTAFVIIPEIAEIDLELLNIPPLGTPDLSNEQQTIRLPCPRCPVPPIVPNVDNPAGLGLELYFSVDRNHPGNNRLLVNGFELYPRADPFHHTLSARMTLGEPGTVSYTDAMPLGFQLAITRPVHGAEDHMLETIDVSLQVIEVADVFVHGMPSVKVRLVRNGPNLKVSDMVVDEPAAPRESERTECVGFLCKWKALLSDRLGRFNGRKPCGGRRKGHAPAHHHRFSPDAQHSHHGLAGTIRYLTSYVVVPLFLGLMVGVSLGIIVLVIGAALASALGTVRGRFPLRCSSRTAANDAAGGEKASLIDNQNPPPAYNEEGTRPHREESSLRP